MVLITDALKILMQQKLTVQLDWVAAGQPLSAIARIARDGSRDHPGAIWVCPLGTVTARPGTNTPSRGTACVEHSRLRFDTTILTTVRALWLSETVSAEGWLISKPANWEIAEQRKVPRITLSDSAGGVYGKLIRDGKDVSTRLWDISALGASFVCMTDTKVTRMAGSIQPIQVYAGGKQVELPGRVVYVRALSSRTSRVGVELDRQASPKAADMLDDVIGELAIRKKIEGAVPWREELRKAG